MTTGSVPRGWTGTKAEWVLYNTLESLGKIPGQDFIYEGRNSSDGVAFRFYNPRDLAINIAGFMQSYASGRDERSVGVMTKQQLIGGGVHLIFIDDVDLEQDATYYVQEALRYRDHSHMGS